MTREQGFKYLHENQTEVLRQTKDHKGESYKGYFYMYYFNGKILDRDGDIVGTWKNDKSEFEVIPNMDVEDL